MNDSTNPPGIATEVLIPYRNPSGILHDAGIQQTSAKSILGAQRYRNLRNSGESTWFHGQNAA
ncbi:hypothetical protein [Burkholderia ambifaria]|uniref:hypothetical protein n=1 Tax=Burkholderia ambifaria TaxID=152480 RepID=UPI0012FD29E8|nr:hypothetical protein [Burkholderia ambifaria]